MRTGLRWIFGLAFLALPVGAQACEPILPLTHLLAGPSVAGPLMLTHSLLWLAAAVGIKSGAFALFERRLTWRAAAGYMLLANVVSTIPGLWIALCASSQAVIFGLPLVGLIAAWIGKRLSRLNNDRETWVTSQMGTIGFIGFIILSGALYYFAEEILYHNGYGEYWVIKFLFVTLVAAMGIVISTVLEESVVAYFMRQSIGNLSFYKSVGRANYVTLGVVLLVAAIEMLPKRLHSPHFIVSWLHSLQAALGLV